ALQHPFLPHFPYTTLFRSGIAEQYGVDLNQIILLNQFDDPNALVVGEAIVIPERGWEYVVQPGDQLWSIAQRFGVTVEELDHNRSEEHTSELQSRFDLVCR